MWQIVVASAQNAMAKSGEKLRCILVAWEGYIIYDWCENVFFGPMDAIMFGSSLVAIF